jgi:hypothetical protein
MLCCLILQKSTNHSSTRKNYSIDGRADSSGTMNKLLNQCEKQENSFRCGSNQCRLVANRSNQFLNVELLEANNKMSLPVFKGLWRANDIDTYLQASYYLYLQKMMAIGLGGATFSYGKFSYLFYDLNEKGLNFTERFEVMYKYLKKDKNIITAPAKATVSDRLAISDCYPCKH